MKLTRLLAFLLLLATWACSVETVPTPEGLNSAYLPLEKGRYSVYDVERIDYNIAGESDTTTFQLKHLIRDYYLNQEQDTVYYLYRYRRETEQQSWQQDSVFLIRQDQGQLILNKNNVHYVQLVFPAENGRSWDANAYNSKEPQVYRIDSLGQTYQLEDSVFNNTLRVLQRDSASIERQDYRFEIYAREVGLIYKYVRTVDLCNSTPDCIQNEVIEGGYQLTQKIADYGKE